MGDYKEALSSFIIYLYIDQKLDTSTKKRNSLIADKLLLFYKKNGQSRDSLNNYISQLQDRGLSKGTLNTYIAIAKHYDKFTGKNELTDLKYFHQETHFTEPLTPEEIKEIAECDRDYHRKKKYLNRFYRTLIYFLALTGCRINEALYLKHQDLLETSAIFRDTKNGEQRRIPVPAFLVKEMKDLNPDDEYIFGHNNKPITDCLVRYELKERAKITGLKKKIYSHVLRHSFITELLRKKVPVSYVAYIVGHKNIQSTHHYTANLIDDLIEAQMQHPLLREKQTYEDMIAKLKKCVDGIINHKICRLIVSESTKSLAIKLERV